MGLPARKIIKDSTAKQEVPTSPSPPTPTSKTKNPLDRAKIETLRDKITTLVDHSPEKAAKIISDWLNSKHKHSKK